MDKKHTEIFKLKTIRKKNEGNKLDDFTNLDYMIIQFIFSQRKKFPHNRLYIWNSCVEFCVYNNTVN